MSEIFTLLHTVGKLKDVERFHGKFWDDYNIDKHETSAEHTWRLCFFLMTLKDKISVSFDYQKTLELLLIHDIAEIYAGDTPSTESFWNNPVLEIKYQKEEKALEKILHNIQDITIQTKIKSLWIEYEKRESIEAKIASTIDKLEWAFQASEYLEKIWIFEEHRIFSIKYTEALLWLDNYIDTLILEVIEKFKQLPTKNSL